MLEEPVADRRNWTIPPPSRRDRSARGGAHQPFAVVQGIAKKKFRWRRPRHTLKGRQTASEVERVGLRLQLRKQQAEAGDIVLLYGDESEALTHPYLARAWAKSGADLRIPAPGQARKVAMLGSLRSPHAPAHRPYQPHQAQQRLHRSSRTTRPPLRAPARPPRQAGRAGRGQRPDPHQQAPPWQPARTGSPSSVRPSTYPNSTTSSRSGVTSRPITSHIRPSPTTKRSTGPSIRASAISTASACPVRWPSHESLLRQRSWRAQQRGGRWLICVRWRRARRCFLQPPKLSARSAAHSCRAEH